MSKEKKDLDRRSEHVIPSTARDLPPHHGDPSPQAPQDDLCGRNGSQGPLKQEVMVFKHDQISLDEIKKLNPQHIVISPGPKSPNEAGISLSVIQEFYQNIPILGICLGHQCLAKAFGGKIISAPE